MDPLSPTRRGLADVGRFVPPSDHQLEQLLGDYPNPGPSASTEFHDAAGNAVAFPRERAHFASRVVSYQVGFPAPLPEGQDARTALGPPDYVPDKWAKPRAVSLGNGGSVVLAFDEGALIDGDGPDLFIWEIGPSVEAMHVDVSTDGKTWISVGTAPGGSCAIDIGPFVSKDDVFHFVRLRDVPNQGGESDEYNQALSERRAQAVAAYLVQKGVDKSRLTARGYGKSRPAAVGGGDEARRRNRRVEIVLRER